MKDKIFAVPPPESESLPPAAGFVTEPQLLAQMPIGCRRTAKNLRDAGKLPFIKIGARVLYHIPSVSEALLRMQRGGDR